MQYFGTVTTFDGKLARAMLCIDADRPSEFMVSWAGKEVVTGGALADAKVEGDKTFLVPRWVYRANDVGGLFLPFLSGDEKKWLQDTRATLTATANGYEGQWTGSEGKTGAITFVRHDNINDPVEAELCGSWEGFKIWANRVREEHDASWFRGHGCRSFALNTSLHRVGRTRMERFTADELSTFHTNAEAILERRFDRANANDYATIMGLAQHHGLPSPLLDWTGSPYIAAFFAFSDTLELGSLRKDSTHVRIFALPGKLVNAISPPTVNMVWPTPFVAALMIAPIHNPRLLAQQGKFLATNVGNIEAFIRSNERDAKERHLFAVDVPVGFAAEALRDLSFMGLTAANMFPGLDGVSRMIRHQMLYRTLQ